MSMKFLQMKCVCLGDYLFANIMFMNTYMIMLYKYMYFDVFEIVKKKKEIDR